MLWYTKTIIFLVKGLKVVAKRCLNWIFFHDDLYCCVKYSNVEYQVEIFKLIIKSDAQKQMVEFSFGRRFHDLNYFEVGIFFIFLEFIIYLRASSQNFVENHQFNVILSYFKQNLDNSLVQYHLLAHHLHHLLKYVDFSWNIFCHHKLLGFVDQYVLNVYDFFFTKFKVSV